MSRQQIIAHYTRLAARWPKDILRPEHSFRSLLDARIQKAPTPARSEEKEVNAAYLLLEKSFSKQFPLPAKLMKPASDPRRYELLAQELKAIPNRSFFGAWMNRLRNMVRFK
ncbi:hypothetical protein AC578_2930 [Pseudocercospora eumusae]|uniref:Uncharacterized protein n=1 Tax=Pseudocercospora eumusae TaxID=321146 RepID=A0A139HEB1_9PEZI|nr:hypothetical protein AC578_2930 [Pseudocercospora eumusae]